MSTFIFSGRAKFYSRSCKNKTGRTFCAFQSTGTVAIEVGEVIAGIQTGNGLQMRPTEPWPHSCLSSPFHSQGRNFLKCFLKYTSSQQQMITEQV